ncbi:MAG: PBSX family phage terminase large subunit [Bacteroidales bacterium]|jgi:phage terminase large subunit|nr:PBSX family phage terminase large subunit [Bacteroidales bacterium]
MEKHVKVSVVFQKNYEAQTKIVVNQGSSRSGKTYSILQLLILVKAFQEKDAIFTIVRKTLPSLKASAMRDFFEILKNEDLYDERHHNKTENTYTLNGNLFEFVSLDQPQKKRGAKRTYLFINEANELTLEDWVQLSIRTEKQIFLDYNPSMEEHWIYDVVLPREDCTFIQSTYLDNKDFLPEEVVKEIENLKYVDENYWRVYGLGLPGQIKGLVFTNWDQVEAFPQDSECKWIVYGMDFGFSNDPTALIKVGLCGGELYLDELIYNRGLTNQDIARWMGELGLKWEDEVIADNQPKCIYEIKKEGFQVKATFKGKDSILAGIDVLKRYKMNVTKRSVNLIRELKNYKWREDQAGKATNVPIDKFNHGIDAVRYAVLAKAMHRRRMVRVSGVRRGDWAKGRL